jgi:hypothetical protein
MQAFIDGEDTRSGDTKKQQMVNEIQDYIIENNICRNAAEFTAYNGVASPELIRKMFNAINKFLVGLLPENPNAKNSDSSCIQSTVNNALGTTMGAHGHLTRNGKEMRVVAKNDQKLIEELNTKIDKKHLKYQIPDTLEGEIDEKGLTHVKLKILDKAKSKTAAVYGNETKDFVFNDKDQWVRLGFGQTIANGTAGVKLTGIAKAVPGKHGYSQINGVESVSISTPSVKGSQPKTDVYQITADGYLIDPIDKKEYFPKLDATKKTDQNKLGIVGKGPPKGTTPARGQKLQPLPVPSKSMFSFGKLKGGKSRKIIFKRNTFKKIDDAPMKKRHTIKKRKNVSKRVIKVV